MNLINASAVEIADLVSRRKVSAREVAQEVVTHVNSVNPTLNALVNFNEQAVLAEAQAVDDLLVSGRISPLLPGVLFSVKDNLWIEGRPASQGSQLFSNHVPSKSAVAVVRARAAGSVVLGTSNCSEFACKGVTTNKLYGATCNPWDLTRTPGGSSGGAAAAVAAGLGHVALCTDAGGSTRRPASHTGVVGFKPSAGAIAHPFGFPEPAFGNSVIGLMARTVADVTAVFKAVAGGHINDPLSPPSAAFLSLHQQRKLLSGMRVAYSPRLGLDVQVDEEVLAAVGQAARWLADAGAEIVQVDPQWPDGSSEDALMPLHFSGLAALFGDEFRRDSSVFDADIAVQIERGLAMSATDVANSLILRETMFRSLAEFFDDYDLLLCPTTPCVAWPLADLGPRSIAGHAVTPRAHAVFTPAFNHVYAPACSVPVGINSEGLPIGAQIVGWHWRDAEVLHCAAQIEARSPERFRRPLPLRITPEFSLL